MVLTLTLSCQLWASPFLPFMWSLLITTAGHLHLLVYTQLPSPAVNVFNSPSLYSPHWILRVFRCFLCSSLERHKKHGVYIIQNTKSTHISASHFTTCCKLRTRIVLFVNSSFPSFYIIPLSSNINTSQQYTFCSWMKAPLVKSKNHLTPVL